MRTILTELAINVYICDHFKLGPKSLKSSTTGPLGTEFDYRIIFAAGVRYKVRHC